MREVIVVCGNRALARDAEGGTVASERWARNLLWKELFGLPQTAIVLNGGCRKSPDQWATEIANQLEREWVQFRANGYRVESDGNRTPWFEGEAQMLDRHHFPLFRNWYMIGAALTAAAKRCQVRVVGLCAPWSKTHGTEQTLSLAEGSGLQTQKFVCDPSLGSGKPVRNYLADPEERLAMEKQARETAKQMRLLLGVQR